MHKLEMNAPISRRRATGVLLATLATAGRVQAQAQKFPSQPLKWIVPYPAGGGSDMIARLVASAMKDSFGQPILIDNRPGAGTIIGMQALLASPADGYTVSTADIATLAYNPSLYSKLPYDVSKSFSFVGGLGRNSFVLVARPNLAVSSFKEFIALARREPGKITFASAGLGSPHHVSMELLQQMTKIKLTHVAYKGGAPAMQDVLAGQVDVMMLDITGGLSNIKAGKLIILGAASSGRLALLPDVPTIEEQGLPGFSAYSWQAMLAPANTPVQVVKRLNADLSRALSDPSVRRRLEELGVEPIPMSPAAIESHAKAELHRWAPVIKTADIKLD